MLKAKVLEAINKQIQHEMGNSYTYRGMALWLDQQLLKGLAAYMKKQSDEERGHAEKLIDYVLDQNESPELRAVDAPQLKYTSVLQLVKAAHALERKTTGMLSDVYAIALKEGDLPTQALMQWFVNEQVEEEKWTEEFVQMATKIGESVGSMFMWDHRVGKLD